MRFIPRLVRGAFSGLARLFGRGRDGAKPSRRSRRRQQDSGDAYVPRRKVDQPGGAPSQTGRRGRPGREQVVLGAFRDKDRGRAIPFKMFMPKDSDQPAPVVIFSHGLGGSRHAASYLGHALSKAGYFGVFIQHPGTDKTILEGATTQPEIMRQLKAATKVPGNMLDRFSDLPFVLDQLERMNSKTKLAGQLDLNRIGMIGHSYGARSTMAAAGQAFGYAGTRFKDARIKAAVPLSPNVTVAPGQSLEGIYDNITIPMLHITGTGDGMVGDEDFDPYTRTIPYRTITAPDQYLLVLDGATHSNFSGREDDGDGGEIKDVVAILVVMFLNAHLKGDTTAYEELRIGFANRLAPEDVFEFK